MRHTSPARQTLLDVSARPMDNPIIFVETLKAMASLKQKVFWLLFLTYLITALFNNKVGYIFNDEARTLCIDKDLSITESDCIVVTFN